MPMYLLLLIALCASACRSNNVPLSDAGTLLSDGSTAPISTTDSAAAQKVDLTAGKAAGASGAAQTAGGHGGSQKNTPDASRTATDGGTVRARDAGGRISTDAAVDARVVQPDASARKPVFKKTACIDPSTIATEADTNFPCNGVSVWVSLPNQCKTRACGLIFNIHGGGMSDKNWMEDATDMIALGKANDYVVVHPHKGTWTVSTDKNVVFSLMEQAIEAFDVDRKRIHATGYSQGGQISWALACEHADVIASVAPAEEINQVSDCWKTAKLPTREIPMLFAFGIQDRISPGGYDAALTAVDNFVKSHSMTGPTTIAGADGTNYHRQRWVSAKGNVFEFIAHNYTSLLAGHCLPQEGASTLVSCYEPLDYNWGEEVMLFFKAHPMP